MQQASFLKSSSKVSERIMRSVPLSRNCFANLVAEQRRRDFAVLHREDGGSGLDHLPFDLHRVYVVLVEEAHRYVVVGVAYSVRYRDVLADEVLRALNRRVGEDVERFASRVYAGRELHAHAVDGGDEHRSDVVARDVYLARAYRVGLRAAAARHADYLRLEPFGLIEALHLGDSEGPEAEAAVVADDYLLAVCGLLLPRLVLGGVSRRPRRLSRRRYQAAEHRAQKFSLHCASSPSIGIYKRLYGFSPQPCCFVVFQPLFRRDWVPYPGHDFAGVLVLVNQAEFFVVVDGFYQGLPRRFVADAEVVCLKYFKDEVEIA